MKISLIAAIGKNRELGKNNKLIWHIPEDMKRFRKLTTGHPIIMGRKTFESIGRVLSNRINIIVTKDPAFHNEGAVVVHSLEEAVDIAKTNESEEIFIIGGGQIYQQAMPIADKLYLTIVDDENDADTFFPDYSDFKKVVFEKKGESEKYSYKFLDLVR